LWMMIFGSFTLLVCKASPVFYSYWSLLLVLWEPQY
jgi:hypothetical protein